MYVPCPPIQADQHEVKEAFALIRERAKLTPKLEKLIKKPGFTGQAPGGPSRWSTERSAEWQPLAPKIVVEVQYDHFSGGRFRHGTSFVRSAVLRQERSPLSLPQIAMARAQYVHTFSLA